MFVVAVSVFIAAYTAIISERIHRTTVAVAAGVLLVALGVLSQAQAFAAIDFNTIGLLMGMMIIVLIMSKTGLFQFVAITAAKVSKGYPVRIMVVLAIVTAVFSAFLNNVTNILLIAPVTFVIADNLKINPLPFLIAEILLSNIGGTATLIGDPPNILIGSAAGFTFMDFVVELLPVVVVISVAAIALLWLVYRKQLKTTDELRANIMNFKARASIKDKTLLVKSLIVLGITVVGFVFSSQLHLEAATVALFGAALLLIITDTHPEEILKGVEWTTILFFAGLFVMVAAIEEVGLLHMIADWMIGVTEGSLFATTMATLWGSAILSAFIDNIPFVATMIPLVQELGNAGLNVAPLWWALALGADMGGNGTLVGASANLVGAGLAEKAGYKLTFRRFFGIGFTVMIVSMIISTAYVWMKYL